MAAARTTPTANRRGERADQASQAIGPRISRRRSARTSPGMLGVSTSGVAGSRSAAAIVFVAFYPNWTGLPLPNGIFNWYQRLLPSWLYPFQFAVNTDPPFSVSFAGPWPLLLLAAVIVSAVIVAYSAWVWRLSLIHI